MKKILKIFGGVVVSLFISVGTFASGLSDLYDNYKPSDYLVIPYDNVIANGFFDLTPSVLYPQEVCIPKEISRINFQLNDLDASDFEVRRGEYLNFIINQLASDIYSLSSPEVKRLPTLEQLAASGIINSVQSLRENDPINFAEFSKITAKLFLDKNLNDAPSDKWWTYYERAFLKNNLYVYKGSHFMTNEEVILILNQILRKEFRHDWADREGGG